MSDIQSHFRTCCLCEAMCGIEIQHKDNKIISIKGDKQDPFSQGHICPKAVALKDLHNDPDRLKKPLKKTSNGFKEISWDEALDETAYEINRIQEKYGKNTFAAYYGNPLAHNHNLLLFSMGFMEILGSRNRFSPTSVDQLPHMLVAKEIFGNQVLLPVADVDNTDFLICIGANPLASQGSLLTAPNFKGKISSIKRKGGEVIVIDPRRTETAEVASEHYFIKPGTDLYLIGTMLHLLLKDNYAIPDHLKGLLLPEQIREVKNLVADFTPAKVYNKTGIPTSTVRELTIKFMLAEKAIIYSRMGTCAQQYGTLTNWLIVAFNILSGNFERPGGLLFTNPALDIPGITSLFRQTGSFNSYQSRVAKLPEFNREFPAVTMIEEIDTPGEGQIKGLITLAGNPVLSTPNGKVLEESLQKLDFMVSVDLYRNETSSHANIILPGTSQLEHSHFDPLFNVLANRNTVKFSPPLFEPEIGTKHDWQILQSLTSRLLRKRSKGKIANRILATMVDNMDPDRMLDMGLRLGPYGSLTKDIPVAAQMGRVFGSPSGYIMRQVANLLDKFNKSAALAETSFSFFQEETPGLTLEALKRQPHGIDLGPLTPSFPERLATSNKKVNLSPKVFSSGLKNILNSNEDIKAGRNELLLIGRRHVRSCNSWLHNSRRLVKGKDRCTAMINPADAKKRKIKDGTIVQVTSRTGTISLKAELTDSIMPGVISIPHGWGHNKEHSNLAVAKKHAGVSVNDITDESLFEKLTGMAVLNGIPVKISKL